MSDYIFLDPQQLITDSYQNTFGFGCGPLAVTLKKHNELWRWEVFNSTLKTAEHGHAQEWDQAAAALDQHLILTFLDQRQQGLANLAELRFSWETATDEFNEIYRCIRRDLSLTLQQLENFQFIWSIDQFTPLQQPNPKTGLYIEKNRLATYTDFHSTFREAENALREALPRCLERVYLNNITPTGGLHTKKRL